MYGSAVNGLCTKNNSDLDLTLITTNMSIPHKEILDCLSNAVKNYKRYSKLKKLEICYGKIL